MKIIVFSDAHGNKYAIQKLLKSKDYKTSDYKIFLGDAITLGPHTNECVDILKSERDLIFTIGNNDSYVTKGLTKQEASIKPDIKLEHLDDVYAELTKENIEFLKFKPKEFVLDVKGFKIYFTHFVWESDTEVVEDPKDLEKETIYEVFKDIDYEYIIFGHLHNRSFNSYNGKVMVGIGSIGAKHKGNYITIEIKNGKLTIKQKLLKYDYKKLKEDYSKSSDRCRQHFYKYDMKETFTNGK